VVRIVEMQRNRQLLITMLLPCSITSEIDIRLEVNSILLISTFQLDR
jgi:hypothetical protein